MGKDRVAESGRVLHPACGVRTDIPPQGGGIVRTAGSLAVREQPKGEARLPLRSLRSLSLCTYYSGIFREFKKLQERKR